MYTYIYFYMYTYYWDKPESTLNYSCMIHEQEYGEWEDR